MNATAIIVAAFTLGTPTTATSSTGPGAVLEHPPSSAERVANAGGTALLTRTASASVRTAPEAPPSGAFAFDTLVPADTASAADSGPMRWNPRWKRVDTRHLLASGGLLAISLSAQLLNEPPLGFKGSVLFDDAVRDLLRPDDAEARGDVALASDIFQNTMILAPFVEVGALALTGAADGDLALSLLAVDIQASLVSLALVTLTKSLIGRIRPAGTPCSSADLTDCPSRNRRSSFVSGHTSAAFTGAGLLCAHHDALDIFGPVGDALTCATALVLATTTGALRIGADQHYATDVLGGAAVGLFSGYAIPQLLHFATDATRDLDPGDRLDAQLALLGVAGFASAPDVTQVGGAELWARRQFWLTPPDELQTVATAVALSAYGRLLRGGDNFAFQQAVGTARFWYGNLAAGFAVDYRSRVRQRVGPIAVDAVETERVPALAIGPTLALGSISDQNLPLVISVRWTPLGDGAPDQLTARVEAGIFRWLALTIEGTALLDLFGADTGGAMLLAGAGGRLPW